MIQKISARQMVRELIDYHGTLQAIADICDIPYMTLHDAHSGKTKRVSIEVYFKIYDQYRGIQDGLR